MFNDGITETLTYDHDLNLSTQNAGATGSINLTYAYDNANNLSSVTDAITAANGQTFGYDVINRLTSAVSGTGGYGTLGWTYNANGNLLTTVNGGVTTTFTTTANTNRITAATATGHSWAYGYTTAGNTNSVTMDAGTPTTQSYGVNNRLASQASGATTVSYIYGAAGERASKTASGTTTKYLNDPAGHLMMEAATGSTPTTEYIYLGNQLVAEYSIAANKLLSVHTDRIGSPFLVTNKLKATQWTATYQPYGATQTTTNPGTITQNVRLPGMQQDAEFGNIHNGFRDYNAGASTNPMQGRYPQADLIGLAGGLNPYRYANANPLTWTDPWGLDGIWIEGSSKGEPGPHQSIGVGEPSGLNSTYSYGVSEGQSAFGGTGVIYQAFNKFGEISEYYEIPHDLAEEIDLKLADMVGTEGRYYLLSYNCRTWSHEQIEVFVKEYKLKPSAPPARESTPSGAYPGGSVGETLTKPFVPTSSDGPIR